MQGSTILIELAEMVSAAHFHYGFSDLLASFQHSREVIRKVRCIVSFGPNPILYVSGCLVEGRKFIKLFDELHVWFHNFLVLILHLLEFYFVLTKLYTKTIIFKNLIYGRQ